MACYVWNLNGLGNLTFVFLKNKKEICPLDPFLYSYSPDSQKSVELILDTLFISRTHALLGWRPPQQECVLNSHAEVCTRTMDCLLALLHTVTLDIRKDEQITLETSTSHTLSKETRKKKDLPFCMPLYPVRVWCPQKPKESSRSLGNEVTYGRQAPYACWKWNPDPLEEQPAIKLNCLSALWRVKWLGLEGWLSH